MTKIYKEKMQSILNTLSIAAPRDIRFDQSQVEALMVLVKTALDTYDPLPTGNALVTDVLAGKTFSNATGTGKTGTLTLAMLTDTANAVAADILATKTAYVNGVKLTGTCAYDADTSDADAVAADILAAKTAYVNGVKLTGTLAYTAIPAPAVTVLNSLKKLAMPSAGLYADLFDSIDVYQGETLEGHVEYVEGSGYVFDLATLAALTGAYHLTVLYTAKSTVTLSDSVAAAVDFNVYAIMRTLTGLIDSNTDVNTFELTQVAGTLSLDEGFNNLPASITVLCGETPLVLNSDFSYDANTGEYTIGADAVTGTVSITAEATA